MNMHVQHPALFLNRDEIQQMRQKIDRYEWAANLYERLKDQAEESLSGKDIATPPGHKYD